MDMSGWLTVAPRLESVNRPATFLPCCKKFKLMWHSGHVGARHTLWFMPLISSRGHFKWKHREFANFTVRHCRGKSTTVVYLEHCREGKKRGQKAASVKSKLTNYLMALWQTYKATCHTNKAANTKGNLWYHCLNRLCLNIQSNKRCWAEGNSQSSGMLWNTRNYYLLSPTIHYNSSSQRGKNKTNTTSSIFRKPWWFSHCSTWSVVKKKLFC